MNCFEQSAPNFEVVFLIIHDVTCHRNRIKQWAKPSHLTELKVIFSVLALLDAFIGMIGLWFQCQSHTPMICHQLWPFWASLDRRWTSSKHILSDVHATFFFVQNSAFLEQSSLPHVSCQKNIRKNCLAWAERYGNIISSLSNGDSTIMQNSFFTASMFSWVVDMLGRPGLALIND